MSTQNESDLLNHLSDLLDDLGELDDTPPETANAPDPVLCIDHPVQTRETIAEVIPLEDARTRRNLRADLVVEGLHAARSAVAVIRQTFNDGAADFDDAVKALPVVHRLIEHVEKIEAAKNLPPELAVFELRPGSMFISPVTGPTVRNTRLLDTADPED